MTDRHPDSRQTDKQNGMTIRLTLCERDATDKQIVIAILCTTLRDGVIIKTHDLLHAMSW